MPPHCAYCAAVAPAVLDDVGAEDCVVDTVEAVDADFVVTLEALETETGVDELEPSQEKTGGPALKLCQVNFL